MRLAELSERSGIPIATIKYYLREGLLPPGERVTATQARYGEEHLRRLGLVRALIQVGRVPVATAREVLSAVDDTSVGLSKRLGTAVSSLPQVTQSEHDGAGRDAASAKADALLEELDWDLPKQDPAYASLLSSIATLDRLGYPCDVAQLLPYGLLANQLAVSDIDLISEFEAPTTRLEAAVALTVLYEPVLLSLRRLAHIVEVKRRSLESDQD